MTCGEVSFSTRRRAEAIASRVNAGLAGWLYRMHRGACSQVHGSVPHQDLNRDPLVYRMPLPINPTQPRRDKASRRFV